MTSAAAHHSQRRGACPGLSVPMPSGDGLLARLRPTGTMSLSAGAALCAAAQRFGNGVIEITSRGSIQIRGLTTASAALFADTVAALAIAADEEIPVHTDVLAGLDPGEILDAGHVARDLRRALAVTPLCAQLSPKVSVAIDGGGRLGLDNLVADVRLYAANINDRPVFHVGVGGDAATAADLGTVAAADGVEAARRLLDVVAHQGRSARARDVLAAGDVKPFAGALSGLVIAFDRLAGARRTTVAEPLGPHSLRDGSIALGLGLTFGHAEARTLENLTQAAKAAGATGIRVAADRALMIIGLTAETAPLVAAEAEKLGLIVRANDPRRYVIACAGAPICASARIAARTLAPAVAVAAQTLVDGHSRIHISGCAKGCAHAGAATLTVVGSEDGRCAIIANGPVHDPPVALAAAHDVPSAIAELMREAKRGARHG